MQVTASSETEEQLATQQRHSVPEFVALKLPLASALGQPQALPLLDRDSRRFDDTSSFHADQPFQLNLTKAKF